MRDDNIISLLGREEIGDPLSALLSEGARNLIQQAVEVELENFIVEFEEHRLEDGRAAVVRNGYHPE